MVNSEIIGHAATKDWKDVPRGIQVWDGSSNIELIDNHFHHFGRAVVILGISNVIIKDNLIDYIHSDGLFFQNSSKILIEDNLLTDFYRTGTVHADYIQFDAGKAKPSHDVTIRGNVMLKGNGNGDVQGIFGDAGDYYEIHKGTFEKFLVENNIYFDTGINGFHFWSGENMILRNNTVLMDPSTSHPNSPSRIFMRGPQTKSVVENNVTLQVAAEGGSTASGNIIVQFKDPSKANYYGNLFSDAFADPASLADLAPKAGTPVGFGSGKGAEKLFQELLGGGGASPVNTAPVANDDTAGTQQGAPVTIKVLANDSDGDGDTLAVASVGKAAHGTVKLNADSTAATYTPAAGFTGNDSFTYAVSDGRGGTDTAHVTVNVAAAIPAPGTTPAPLLASEAQTFNGTKGAALVLPHQQAYEVADGTLDVTFTADAVSGRRGLFSKDAINFGTGGHFTIQIEDGALVVRIQSQTQSFTVTTARDAIEAGHQHHAAITFGSEGLKLYLDGVLTGTNAYTGGLTGNAEPVVIGASQTTSGPRVADVLSDFFDGTIAKVALYNQALETYLPDAVAGLADPVDPLLL
ncbi:MAG TPA: Ig-like domain-containing protein, partial [Candidatus Limnocylindria bacterium]|nr:Ig-like domain-containing protein [Candidatus Limnocylindria bacterium]